MPGEAWILWTVRLSLAAYVASVAVMLWGGRERLTDGARGLWTAGCVLMGIHVAAAFHFAHHWSHDSVWEDTARQTAETTGLDWGGGVYFNYALLAIWGADTAWWWISPKTYASRAVGWTACVHGFLAFIAFNATVVFKTGALRWIGVAGTCGLAILAGWRLLGVRTEAAPKLMQQKGADS